MVFIGWQSPKLSILESFRVRVALQRPGLAGGQWPYRCHVGEAPSSVGLQVFSLDFAFIVQSFRLCKFRGKGREGRGLAAPRGVG